MKRDVILIMTSVLIALAGSVSAAEHKETSEKDLCILYARDCAKKVYNLRDYINKIQEELAKGTKVYRANEIKKLKEKLKEAEDMMYELTPGPSPQK